jgi:hypothetical protein
VSTESLGACPEQFELLRSALDHIARTARNSRSQTRLIRWIEARATGALRGEPYLADAIDLPKTAGPNTVEKLKKSLMVDRHISTGLLNAAQKALADHPSLSGTPAGDALRFAIADALAIKNAEPIETQEPQHA